MSNDKVWSTIFNNEYVVKVERIKPFYGKIILSRGQVELHSCSTTLIKDAKPKPDVCDVKMWRDKALEWIHDIQK